MKGYIAFACLLPVLAAATPAWREEPVSLPLNYTQITAVAVNDAMRGFAFAGDGHVPGDVLTLQLNNGLWTPLNAAPTNLIKPSIAPDGTLYAVDTWGGGYIYRLSNSQWKIAGVPGKVGVSTFTSVAAVDVNEFWAAGATPAGYCVAAHFIRENPDRIYNLGPLNGPNNTSNIEMVIPRAAFPSCDCYVTVRALGNPFNHNRWFLYVLEAGGGFHPYPFPRDDYYGDGITAYNPGEVRVMLSKLGAGSLLYGFSNGVFNEVLTFPERVRIESQPAPTDGWGFNSATNRIYHWTGGGFAPAVTLDGELTDLDMVSPTEGWAVGCKTESGVYTPAMWHYSDVEPSLTPTSLGRVKAAFR